MSEVRFVYDDRATTTNSHNRILKQHTRNVTSREGGEVVAPINLQHTKLSREFAAVFC
jgi:hypothetical protein